MIINFIISLTISIIVKNIIEFEMGNFLSFIKQAPKVQSSALINSTGSKMREYYCSYRSICQNFVISIAEYIQIFGFDVKSFQIWDTENEGFLNAFQIFTGLILFSDVQFEEKARFLFQIYDLNEEGFLDYEGILFLFDTIVQAVFKIYQLPIDETDAEEQIRDYLNDFYSEDAQINCEDFILWCHRTQQVPLFFKIIDKDFKQRKKEYAIDRYEINNNQSPENFTPTKYYRTKIAIDHRFVNMLKVNRIIQQNYEKNCDFNPSMKWIYGISIKGSEPIKYQAGKNNKASNEKLIYITSKNIVMLYPKFNKQQIYSKHDLAVSTLDIAHNSQIVASGEYGINPVIHIWDMKTLQTLTKFQRIHKTSIVIIKFLHNEELLATVGDRKNSPLVVINIKKKEKILGTYFENTILRIIQLPLYQKKPVKNKNFLESQNKQSTQIKCNDQRQFYIILKNCIAICKTTKGSETYQIISKKTLMNDQDQFSIKHCISICASNTFRILILDENHNFYLWFPELQEFKLILFQQQEKLEKAEIMGLMSSKDEGYFYILYAQRIQRCKINYLKNYSKDLKVINLSKEQKMSQQFRISATEQIEQIPFHLYNGKLVYLIETSQNSLIAVSQMGDIIKIMNFQNAGKNDKNQNISVFQENQRIMKKKSTKNNQIFTGNNDSYQREEQQCQDLNSSESQKRIHNYEQEIEPSTIIFKKYYQIFKLENITAACEVESEEQESNILQKYENYREESHGFNLVICCKNLLYTINQKEHQLTRFQVFQQPISHISSYGCFYVISLVNKYLMILKNGKTIEKYKYSDNILPTGKYEQEQQKVSINAIKLTKEFLVVANHSFLEVFTKIGGNYFQHQPKKIKIEVGIPIHICSTGTKKVFLVMTKEKLILKLDLESKDKNMVYSAKQLYCDSLTTLYPQSMSLKLPILFSESKSVYLLSQPNGQIYFWNSLSHMISEESSFSVLSGHSSSLKSLIFKNQEAGFISAGSNDCTVILWQSKQAISQNQNPQSFSCTDHVMTQKKPENYFGEEEGIHYKKREKRKKLLNECDSKSYKEQIRYLQEFRYQPQRLKDSQIEVLTKDVENYRGLKNIINNILIPKQFELYQPLIDKNNIIGAKVQNLEKSLEQTGDLNIQLSYIYGFSSQQIRQSLFYVHKYPHSRDKASGQSKYLSNLTQQKQADQTNFSFAKKRLEPLDLNHRDCKRKFAYFSGRFCIVACPYSRQQEFYNYHQNKVTCIAIHPEKNIICSAQLTSHKAILHIWDIDKLSLIEEIQTSHLRFISKLKFSSNGQNILSLGGCPSFNSLQIHEWSTRKSKAFRRMENIEIFDLQWNPYQPWQIAVCGSNTVSIYKISNKTFIRQQKCTPQSEQQDFTCMVYTSNIYGNSIESDIIVGNNFGDLSMFICGKYAKCKKKAHSSVINCLRMCELFHYKTVLISAGEDNFVKLWDTKFNQIGKISLADKNIELNAPQSIDIYNCLQDKNRKRDLTDNLGSPEFNLNQALLLIGMRNGSITEIKISEEYKGLKKYKDKPINPLQVNVQIQETEESIKFNQVQHYKHMPSSCTDEMYFDIRENLMITYTTKLDSFILWNLSRDRIIKQVKISGYPSVIKFSTTNLLAIGYIDGRIQFYQLFPDGTITLREQKINLSLQQFATKIIFGPGDIRIAVVSIKKQHNSDRFNQFSQYSQRQQNRQIITVYENVLNPRHYQHYGSNENNRFQKIIIENSTKLNYVYWLEFNSHDTQQHNQRQKNRNNDLSYVQHTHKTLLICYTKNDYSKIYNSNKKQILSESNQEQQSFKFVLYDLAKKCEVQLINEDFQSLNFSPAIKAIYRFYPFFDKHQINSQNIIENQKEGSLSSKKQEKKDFQQELIKKPTQISSTVNQLCTPFTQMAQFDCFTILGTVNGEICILKSMIFYQSSDGKKLQYTAVKTYRCSDSPITKMHVANNNLYVSSKQSSSIFKLTLIVGNRRQHDVINELDLIESDGGYQNKNYQPKQKREKIVSNYSFETLLKKSKQIFPKRKYFYEYMINSQQAYQELKQKNILAKFEDSSQNGINIKNSNEFIELEVKHILGRRSFSQNNNIFMDLKHNIISYSGCNLCLNYYDPLTQKYQQNFIKPDSHVFSSNPEITTILLANDKQTLYIGTTQQRAQLIIWDISTKTDFDHILFPDYISIQMVKVSQTQSHCILLAVSRLGKKVLFFITLKEMKVLACCTICNNKQRINDMNFVPEEQYSFLACGPNYIAEWSYHSGLLVQREYLIQNPKDFIQLGSKQTEKDEIIFFSVIFIRNIAITSGSDGYLYLWKDKKLVKKQNAHPKTAILSLFVSLNSHVFASGAVDGKAIVWQLGSNSVIQKILEFNIYQGKQEILPPKYHIQSVCIGQNDIILGTRSGDIYKFNWKSQTQILKNNESFKNKGKQYSIVLSAFDDDEINSCSFNISSQKLFILTQSGVISVFNLQTYQKINQQRMNINNTKIVKMLTSKLSNKIFIVVKKGIEIYQYQQNEKSGSKKVNRFKKAKQSLKYTNSEIKAAVLSLNEKYLAILLAPNHLQNSKIEIYQLKNPDGKTFYPLYKLLENIPENIEIIDFSTDNGYLMYKNLQEDETIIELITKQIISPQDIQFDLQWHEEAKKTSGAIRNICSVYSDENKLQNVVQIVNNCILATDEMGSIRLFYQMPEDNIASYYRIYLEHLNDVIIAVLSSDCMTLITVGREDRSLIIWKINNLQSPQEVDNNKLKKKPLVM